MPLLTIRTFGNVTISGLLAVSLLAIFPMSADPQSSERFKGADFQMEAKEIGGARKEILITFRDASGKASPVTTHVYFIGQESTNGARFIYAHSELSVNFKGATGAIAKVEVAELKPKPNKHAPVGYVYTYTGVGDREGWVILARMNGRMLQTRASSPVLLELARGKSRDSLDSMVAAYEKSTGAPARRP